MKRTVAMLAAVMLLGLGGQAGAAAQDQPREGLAKLTITGNIKTHAPGHFVLDRGDHGTEAYAVTVVLDDERLVLRTTPLLENLEDPTRRDPEFGEGVRYRFERTVYVAPGRHRLTVRIPEDGVEVVKSVELGSGGGRIELQPVYGATHDRPGYYGESHFLRGVKELRVVLDGKVLQ
jgi:hypothetical protein